MNNRKTVLVAVLAALGFELVNFTSCSADVKYKEKIVEKKTFVCSVCEQEYETAEQLKECQQTHKNELTQEELQNLLNGSSKESIYELVLASKNAAELLEKLSTTQKAEILDKLLTDEKKTEVFNEKLTDTEKERIFNELVDSKRENNTFLTLLTADEKTAVFNNELTTDKKAAIFDEIFDDKRTNSEVVGLLDGAEKETVFNALLTTKTSVDFVKEILNKEGNEDLRKSVKNYLVAELSQDELWALLEAKDITAPENVTNLTATNLDGAVLLKWTDPSALDLFGVEITFTPYVNPSAARAISLAQDSIFVTPGVQAAEITNLTNGTNYTFTLKVVDTTGNKSSGVSKSITPSVIEKAVMTIGLVPDTTAITNQNVTVSVNPVTSATVKTIKYASGERAVSYFTSSGTTITSAKIFTVTENGTYTVFVQDSDGRREVNTITINNIDKTSPAAVDSLSAVYSVVEKKITVSWTNPEDADFSHVLLSYTKGGDAVVTDEKLTANTYTVSEVELEGEEYEFTVKACDVAGNTSNVTTTSVKSGIGAYDADGNLLAELTKEEVESGCLGVNKSAVSVVIPKGATRIGNGAFGYWISLTSIKIPDSVTSIGAQAFDLCSNLTSIEIPNSVTSIGDMAFNACTGLTSIVIPEGVTEIGAEAFKECTSLTSIKISEGVTSIGAYAFAFCSNLTSIVIPEGVTSIDYGTFDSCTRLASVVIPESVTSIGYDAFRYCTSLTALTFCDTTTWYRTNSSSNWNNKTGGIQEDVSNPTQNATWFSSTSGYADYYWYKL